MRPSIILERKGAWEAGWGRERVALIKRLITWDRKDALEAWLPNLSWKCQLIHCRWEFCFDVHIAVIMTFSRSRNNKRNKCQSYQTLFSLFPIYAVKLESLLLMEKNCKIYKITKLNSKKGKKSLLAKKKKFGRIDTRYCKNASRISIILKSLTLHGIWI